MNEAVMAKQSSSKILKSLNRLIKECELEIEKKERWETVREKETEIHFDRILDLAACMIKNAWMAHRRRVRQCKTRIHDSEYGGRSLDRMELVPRRHNFEYYDNQNHSIQNYVGDSSGPLSAFQNDAAIKLSIFFQNRDDLVTTEYRTVSKLKGAESERQMLENLLSRKQRL